MNTRTTTSPDLLDPLDLLILPDSAEMIPGAHLTADQARQALRDWYRSPLGGGTAQPTWLIGIAHIEDDGVRITSTLRVIDSGVRAG